jgi:pyruvate/2-oxoglutarate dehydrogenase complex dihydrolipoamide acyltransferase (E2) component
MISGEQLNAMPGQDSGFETRAFPLSRRLVMDACEWGRKKHTIHIFAEIDVTHARELLRDLKIRTGESLSFTAFVASCIGRTVAEDRMWHAYRRGMRLVLFHDVDVATLVERQVEGEKLATAFVIRSANTKTVREIHGEIRAAQQENIDSAPGVDKWKAFLRLPRLVRMLLYRLLDRHPAFRKRLAGTVLLTAVGMAAKGGGWGVPIASNTLTVTLGGIQIKPGFVEGRIEPREYLCATVSFDHDIVDGMPAARFVARFRELVEEASGLLGDHTAGVAP